jgi:hypothetical protein
VAAEFAPGTIVSALSSSASLIVALAGLSEVQSVINAIRTADLTSAAARLPTVAGPCDTYCPCPTLARQPCYLPRRVIHPTPRYLPRPVLHPTPRVEPNVSPPPHPTARTPHITAGPQPPWKIMPWQEPAKPASVIKVCVRPPDMLTKGNLIDLFI